MKRILALTFLIFTASMISLTARAQPESRDDVIKQIEARRAELSVLEKKILVPSDEDRAAYADFLAQPDTGLIRLMPREVYDNMLAVRGGGAYYSFTRLAHEYGAGSDIELQQGWLSVGFAGANYGMLIKVGDVPLDQVTTEFPSVKFLSAYSAVTAEPNARIEHRRFSEGTTVGGVTYANRQRAEVKTTYVVRSIDYSTSDVLVAFRVIRKDRDGSLIILWKLLKSYAVTDLARQN